jgi:hypothetical protein
MVGRPRRQIEKAIQHLRDGLDHTAGEGGLHRLDQHIPLHRATAAAGPGDQGLKGRPAHQILQGQQ